MLEPSSHTLFDLRKLCVLSWFRGARGPGLLQLKSKDAPMAVRRFDTANSVWQAVPILGDEPYARAGHSVSPPSCVTCHACHKRFPSRSSLHTCVSPLPRGTPPVPRGLRGPTCTCCDLLRTARQLSCESYSSKSVGWTVMGCCLSHESELMGS